MSEHKLFTGEFPFTPEWYLDRPHAPHLEQAAHATRLRDVSALAHRLCEQEPAIESIVDLGAGDGGLLSTLQDLHLPMWGYDLSPANADHARLHRGVDVALLDFQTNSVNWGDLCLITECLEHLEDPHRVVKRIGHHSRFVIASSPVRETPSDHDACHAWCWDTIGYADLIMNGGYQIVDHFISDPGGYGFQVILGEKLPL
jgi:hypothetical protein